MYGASDLGQYGSWRTTQRYGRVWVPSAVGPTWAPYTTGQWMWDPYYGWTWVDDAPWGWAPYHYGRWVYWDNYWAWAPGPVLGPPVYAPALVGFFGFPGVHVGVSFGTPIGWVALGWGEPLIPWWGGAGFVGVPCWRGWHGPHVVNNVFVNHTDVIHVDHIDFTNTHVPHAVVAVARDRFGNGAVERARIGNVLQSVDGRHLRPIRGPLPVRGGARNLVAGAGPGRRPPEAIMARRVVATRAPHTPMAARDPAATRLAGRINPQPRLVPAVQRRLTDGGRMANTTMRDTPQRPQPSAALQGGKGRLSAVAPDSDATMHIPKGASPRGESPRMVPPPHGSVGAREAPSQRQAALGRSEPPLYRLGPGHGPNDAGARPQANVSRRTVPPPPPGSASARPAIGNAPVRGDVGSRAPQHRVTAPHGASPDAPRQQLQTRAAPAPPVRDPATLPRMSAPRLSQPETMPARPMRVPQPQAPRTEARQSQPRMPGPRFSAQHMNVPAPQMNAPAPRMSAPAPRMSAPAPRMSAPAPRMSAP